MASEDAADSNDLPDEPTNNVVPSFSFSGCGFLGVYHVGVAACLRDHTDIVNRREIRFAGASAGALVATTLLCDVDFGEVTKLLLLVAKAIRNRENIDLANLLKDLMNHYLPDDAHIRLRNRLYISVTVLNGMKSALITNFHSKEHLIQCLIASSFVPGFVGWIPPVLDGEDFVKVEDGIPPVPLFKGLEVSESEGEEEAERQDEAAAAPNAQPAQGLDADSIWGILSAENEACNKKNKDKESYLRMLVRICFMSWRTTTKVVHKVPGASQILGKVTPQILSQLDEFMEALVLEMMSNRYAAFDGGFSDNIPCFDSNTITICPFSGESDICPKDITGIDFNIDLGRTSMQASEDNIFRLNHALNPLEPEMLLKLCEEGYNECLRFLHKKDLLSCKKHLMTRAAISASPCNIGHAHCRCPLCKAADAKIRRSLSCVDCHKIKQKALISLLPQDVRNEFFLAIEEHRHPSNAIHHSYWSKLIGALWWCAEKMYSNTIKLTDLAIDFSQWLYRFWDSAATLTDYALVPLRHKRRLIRRILSSLRNFISTSMKLRLQRPCPVQSAKVICS